MQQPNILFVLSDQFRAMCLEDDPVRTPNLDRLARESVRLTQAMSSYPVCSPHRAMLLSGQHPMSNGVPMNLNSANMQVIPGLGLRDDIPTWASVLHEQGYRTGLIGKLHLEPPQLPDDEQYGEGRRSDGKVWDAWSPPHRRFGFEFWYSHGCSDQHLKPHYWTTEAGRDQRTDVDQWSAQHETDIAIKFLEDNDRDRPFALFLSWNPPHQPFDELPPHAPLQRYEAMSPKELLVRPNVDHDSEAGHQAAQIAPMYFAAVEAIDQELGRLVEALERLNLADDTIVVFTSDHGMQLGSHDLIYKNVPFEESMRLPCIIRIPGVTSGQTHAMLTSIDIAPTLIGLAGHSEQIPRQMHGRDLSSVIRGEEPVDQEEASLYFRWPVDSDPTSARGVVTHRWKYVVTRQPDGECSAMLINRVEDPYEMQPVSLPEVESALAGRLADELDRSNETWEGLDWLRARAGARTRASDPTT